MRVLLLVIILSSIACENKEPRPLLITVKPGHTTMHSTNHFATLETLKTQDVPCHGVTISSHIPVGGTTGTWRNDTGGFVIITGAFLTGNFETGNFRPLVTLQAGDRQVTGGPTRLDSLVNYAPTGHSRSPLLSWPGLGQPVPSGEQVTMTISEATPGTVYTYTAVQVDDLNWSPPIDWLEPRWITITSENRTGQQTRQAQLPYRSIIWDWMQGNNGPDNGGYLDTTIFRFMVDVTPITLNSQPMNAIPPSAYSPSSQILLPATAGATLWFYIDTASVADDPAVLVRLAKNWGDTG